MRKANNRNFVSDVQKQKLLNTEDVNMKETEVQATANSINRPVKSYRCGSLNGAIWANEKATTEGMVSFMTASLKKLERQVRQLERRVH